MAFGTKDNKGSISPKQRAIGLATKGVKKAYAAYENAPRDMIERNYRRLSKAEGLLATGTLGVKLAKRWHKHKLASTD